MSHETIVRFARCSSCGALLPMAQRYCADCGAAQALPAEAVEPPPAWEPLVGPHRERGLGRAVAAAAFAAVPCLVLAGLFSTTLGVVGEQPLLGPGGRGVAVVVVLAGLLVAGAFAALRGRRAGAGIVAGTGLGVVALALVALRAAAAATGSATFDAGAAFWALAALAAAGALVLAARWAHGVAVPDPVPPAPAIVGGAAAAATALAIAVPVAGGEGLAAMDGDWLLLPAVLVVVASSLGTGLLVVVRRDPLTAAAVAAQSLVLLVVWWVGQGRFAPASIPLLGAHRGVGPLAAVVAAVACVAGTAAATGATGTGSGGGRRSAGAAAAALAACVVVLATAAIGRVPSQALSYRGTVAPGEASVIEVIGTGDELVARVEGAFDSTLEVRELDGRSVAYDDDTIGLLPEVRWSASHGRAYELVVRSFSGSESGPFVVVVEPHRP